MNIHEYQAKQLLKGYGVNVLEGGVAYTADEAREAAQNLGVRFLLLNPKSTQVAVVRVNLKKHLPVKLVAFAL